MSNHGYCVWVQSVDADAPNSYTGPARNKAVSRPSAVLWIETGVRIEVKITSGLVGYQLHDLIKECYPHLDRNDMLLSKERHITVELGAEEVVAPQDYFFRLASVAQETGPMQSVKLMSGDYPYMAQVRIPARFTSLEQIADAVLRHMRDKKPLTLPKGTTAICRSESGRGVSWFEVYFRDSVVV